MQQCKRCKSWAINHNSHGRDGSDGDLCDVCYWRKRAEALDQAPKQPATAAERIFVFGSNLAGRHGKGAALFAKNVHGAKYGVGVGRTGNAYAIPTKDEQIRTLTLARIAPYVSEFLAYAKENQHLQFEVTKIGCGLAGYKEHEISPMFRSAPPNCSLPDGWR